MINLTNATVPAPAQQVADLVVRVVLLQRVEDHLRRPPQRAVGVHGDERGQEEAVALADRLLVAGVRQVLLERQDGGLLHHGRLQRHIQMHFGHS